MWYCECNWTAVSLRQQTFLVVNHRVQLSCESLLISLCNFFFLGEGYDVRIHWNLLVHSSSADKTRFQNLAQNFKFYVFDYSFHFNPWIRDTHSVMNLRYAQCNEFEIRTVEWIWHTHSVINLTYAQCNEFDIRTV